MVDAEVRQTERSLSQLLAAGWQAPLRAALQRAITWQSDRVKQWNDAQVARLGAQNATGQQRERVFDLYNRLVRLSAAADWDKLMQEVR